MNSYLVTWRIDIDADNPTEAAAQALIMMRDGESTATVFDVLGPDGTETTIDLNPEHEE